MPYAPALALWVFATFPAYLVAIRAIVGDRTGYVLAAAFPAVLCNFIDGQNGFLSAALIGGTLVLLPRKPVLAGVLLGLLTYKPHLGILFPIVLAADGRWRTFVSAGVTAALMAIVAWLAFGTGACLLIAVFPFVTAPVGFTAALIVAAMIARRVLAPHDEMTAPAAA
jgi:hypothetical protein